MQRARCNAACNDAQHATRSMNPCNVRHAMQRATCKPAPCNVHSCGINDATSSPCADAAGLHHVALRRVATATNGCKTTISLTSSSESERSASSHSSMNARMLCVTADCTNTDTTSAADISAETAQQHRARVCNVESLPLFSRSADRVGVRAVVCGLSGEVRHLEDALDEGEGPLALPGRSE